MADSRWEELFIGQLNIDVQNIEDKVDIVDGIGDDIKVVTDAIPDNGSMSSIAKEATLNIVDGIVDDIKTETEKIDSTPTNGLDGVVDSLSYRIEEIEKHIHSREKWFGLAVAPNAELHVADRMGPSVQPFTLTTGNNDFGAWVQVLGSEDTPVKSGSAFYDAHSTFVVNTDSTSVFLVQIVAGESADIADNIANELYSEFPFLSASNQIDSGEISIYSSRIPSGTKAWARAICIGQNAKIIQAYFGLHEYEG